MVDLINEIAKYGSCSSCSFESECNRQGGIVLHCVGYDVVDGIKSWLNSFNTDSATVCFTAIQELKKVVNKDE